MSQPSFDFGDTELDDPANPTYSVGELAEAINATLRRGFSDGVWVRGEITGWSDRGQHAYFSLVDDSDDGVRRGRAVINVSFFANSRMRLRPLLQRHRLRLADGMKVRVFGYLDFYAPNGRIGLKMTGIDPRYTLGDIAQSRDEVLRRLVADGVFDANKRRRLAEAPLHVGVVTSVGTAAWHDFHDELSRSGYGFSLRVVDTRVQGDGAERMVAASIATLARDGTLDAIVVIRGGGARNELAVFDAEAIARAIVGSPVPVLTGLGHEVDRSVADEVAHTTLKTPTACAGALVQQVTAHVAGVEAGYAAIIRRASARLAEADRDLTESAHRIARRTHAAVERADERLAMRVTNLVRIAPSVVAQATRRVDDVDARLRSRSTAVVQRATDRLDVLAARTAALDPAVQLARGWSITRRADGAIVRTTHDIAAGDELTTRVADGIIVSSATSASTEPPANHSTDTEGSR